jgi:peptide methionine sulfoxide reductase MsrA
VSALILAYETTGTGLVSIAVPPYEVLLRRRHVYHQQYLDTNPFGYCGHGGTGVACPVGLTSGEA